MKFFALFALFCGLFSMASEEFKVVNIIKLDPVFSPYVAVVEKSTHTLKLFKNNNTMPELVKTYPIATGKFTGDKKNKGDRKTPEGVYTMQEFLSSEQLLARYGDYGKMYGIGAFTLNYPNIMDRRLSKTGGGIWLHSTNDESRIDKGLDSRGCVVVNDENLKDISQYVSLQNTPMIIVQDLNFAPVEKWNQNREKLDAMINDWQKSWVNKDFDRYISHYDPKRFQNYKGNYYTYKNYKRAVFARPDTPEIKFTNTSILVHKDYAVVQMLQDYKSDVIQDFGKKTLYLQQDEFYNWKIVTELWTKVSRPEELAFVPSMRFFKEDKQ